MVMVPAPRSRRPCQRWLYSRARRRAGQSTPWWAKKRPSSAATTARRRAGLRARLRRTDVIAPSLAGFGCPLPEGFAASKEAYVDWLAREIERVGGPVDLVGHDWGALLVQRLVSLRPDLVRTWACGNGPADAEYVWHDIAQQWQTPGVGEQIMEAFTPAAMAEALAAAGVPAESARETAQPVAATLK